MSGTVFAAYIYPPNERSAVAISTIEKRPNGDRFVAARRVHPPIVFEPQGSIPTGDDQNATQQPEAHDILEYLPCWRIDLDDIPKSPHGLIGGTDYNADFTFPKLIGISFHHISFTFNDDYCFVVRDLESGAGTSVAYGDHNPGVRKGQEWIIGGDDILQEYGPIKVMVTTELQFRVVVDPFDINSETFRAKVDKFRKGRDGLSEVFSDLDIFRPPTQLPSQLQTPSRADVLLTKRLGEGSFAVVSRVWNARTGALYALKQSKSKDSEYEVRMWRKEAELMTRTAHPHIVELLEFKRGPPLELHFEYLAGGSLRDHLGRGAGFSAFERVHITRQTLSALDHLHNKLEDPITHRDISDANILVEHRRPGSINVKLGDFGLSKEGLLLRTRVGTPLFFPPEFFNRAGEVSEGEYTNAVDIWELAVVIAILICDRPVYKDRHRRNGRLWCESIRARVADHFDATRDQLSGMLLSTMLRIDPDERMGAEECHQRSLSVPEDEPTSVRATRERMLDPTDPLFLADDIGGRSRFSDDLAGSESWTATPARVQAPASSTARAPGPPRARGDTGGEEPHKRKRLPATDSAEATKVLKRPNNKPGPNSRS
ncbi:kinase-like domain-containing protein [Xylariomycetidae sp. FL0641]|nr:kinase-like domain-containing protein [Xylariomycetidae sp. FL0641]